MIEKDIFTCLLVGLVIKHFVADFLFQTNWMAINKGTFLHPGGLAHSGLHALFTLVLLVLAKAYVPAGWLLICGITVAEFVIHYAIDYGKMNLDKKLNYSHLTFENGEPTSRVITHTGYYLLLGADQLLHYLTYAAIIYMLF